MALTNITQSLPDFYVGETVDLQLVAVEGTLPYAWSVTSGALPSGLTLSPAGLLSGTPVDADLGGFSVTIRVTDGASAVYNKTYNFSVKPGNFAVTEAWLLDSVVRIVSNSYPLDYFKHDVVTKLFHYGLSGSSFMFNASAVLVKDWTGLWPHAAPVDTALPEVLDELAESWAENVQVDTTNFTTNLTVADNTVQKALETIDQFVLGGGGGGLGRVDAVIDGVGAITGHYATVKAATDAGKRTLAVTATITETANNTVSGTIPVVIIGAGGSSVDLQSFNITLPDGSTFRDTLVQGIVVDAGLIKCSALTSTKIYFNNVTFQINNAVAPLSQFYLIDGNFCAANIENCELFHANDVANASLIALQMAGSRIDGLNIWEINTFIGSNIMSVVTAGGFVTLSNMNGFTVSSPNVVTLSTGGTGVLLDNLDAINITCNIFVSGFFSNIKNSSFTVGVAMSDCKFSNCYFTTFTDSAIAMNTENDFNNVTIDDCPGMYGTYHKFTNFKIANNTSNFYFYGGFNGVGCHQITNCLFNTPGFDTRISSHCCQITNVKTMQDFIVSQNVEDAQFSNIKVGLDTSSPYTFIVHTGALRTVIVGVKTPTGTITDNAALGQTQVYALSAFSCNLSGGGPIIVP